MANFVTNWIMEMTDRVTGTAKDIARNVRSTSNEFKTLGSSSDKSMAGIKKELDEGKKALKSYQQKVEETQRKIKSLTDDADLKHAAGSEEWKKAKREIEKLEEELVQYKHSVNDTKSVIRQLDDAQEQMASASGNRWGNMATGINQTVEIIQKVTDALDFGPEITKLQTHIQQMTGATGAQLDLLTQKSYRLSQVFGEDSEAIALAANATAKNMRISYTEALDLIEKGYEKGANINGDMLDQLKEYGPQMEALGLNASQMLALMSKAGKEGVFSDKALDSLKEANLSLREMGQPQIDALKAIGLEAKDLSDKTSFEAVQMIVKSMKGATTQARQMVLTDIFKGAGEDAGFAWIEGLDSVDMDINKIPSVKQSGASMRGWLADLKSRFATTFSSIAANSQMIGGLAQTVAGMIPVMNALRSSTTLATAAQWAMNIAGYANPYVAMAAAVIALVAALGAMIVYFEDVNAALSDMWENSNTVTRVLMVLFGVLNLWLVALYGIAAAVRFVYDNFNSLTQLIEDVVVHGFKSILAGVVGIGDTLWKLITGDFSGAAAAGKEAILNITGVNTMKEAYKGAAGIGKAWSEGLDAGVAGGGPSLAKSVSTIMNASNSTIVDTMKKMGAAHGTAYVDAKIEAAEKWAKYMDTAYNTDRYSKKVAEAKAAWGTERKNVLDGKVVDTGNKTKGSKSDNGMSISGGASAKGITMHLTFHNTFNAVKGVDIEEIANDLMGIVNDRLKDAALTL